MRAHTALPIVILLCGCTSVSTVQGGAGERYAVSATTSNPIVSWRHLMNADLDNATEFCARQDKAMHTVEVLTFGVRGFSQREANLRFECVPRWQRE